MKGLFALSFGLAMAAFLAACSGEGMSGMSGMSGMTAETGAATSVATVTAGTTETPAATATASAATTAAASATASAGASGSPATSGSAAAGAKTFDCGAKGQKACPLQGWMKSAMGSAVASGDAARISRTLASVAAKPVPGFGEWSAIASEGSAKAAAGDIDGAKQSCKKCHDKYKYKYQTTMRDRPW